MQKVKHNNLTKNPITQQNIRGVISQHIQDFRDFMGLFANLQDIKDLTDLYKTIKE